MDKPKKRDLSGVETPLSSFIPLRRTNRNQPSLDRGFCSVLPEAVGLGRVVDEKRYGHLSKADRELMQWYVGELVVCGLTGLPVPRRSASNIG